MGKVIGQITTCNSTEHPYLAHHEVKIVAVIKAKMIDGEIDEDDCDIIITDGELARLGGLEATDRVEVQPWLEQEGRFSFVTSDPKAIDLAAFDLLSAATATATPKTQET